MTSPAAPSPRLALAGLSLCVLLSSLGTSIANVALPTLAAAFGAAFQDVQWVVLAYLLASTTLIVSVGRLGDLIGRRRLLLIGIALFALASIASAVAPGLWFLVAARAGQGLGAAIMMALALALVGETVPRQRIGSAMGLMGTMSAVGTAMGPALGGVLIAAIGWPAIFLLNLPLGLLALMLVWRFLPAHVPLPDRARTRFDAIGTVLLASTLLAYALAMTVGRGSFGLANLGLLVVAAIGLVIFLLVENRRRDPLFRPAMLARPELASGLATSTLVSTVIITTMVVGSFYLSLGLGLPPGIVGLIMAIGPVLSALTGFVAGRLVDRFGAGRAVVFGLVEMVVGLAFLAALPPLLGAAGFIAAMAVMTPGYQLFMTANNTAIMADIELNRRGVVSGLLNLSRNLGLITGASAMGAVFALGTGAADVTTADAAHIATGTWITFTVGAGLIAVAVAVAVRARRRGRRGAAEAAEPGGFGD